LVKVLASTVLLFLLLSCAGNEIKAPNKAVKNIILYVGDGMGPAYLTAYRMYKDLPSTEVVETTLFDTILVGSLRTDPQGLSGKVTDDSASAKALATGQEAHMGQVTDSAASATAFATGLKTFNGSLSVDPANKPLPTVLEKAKQLGKSTGMVVTSQIYHATPAAFAAHELNRDNYTEIANQYFDNQYNQSPYVDILMGGGDKHFIREDRNLAAEFEQVGYQFVSNKQQLLAASSNKVLGLFAHIGLDKMLDRNAATPSLADMTRVAIQKLSKNPNGFFLLVEGSQIDWAGHENDIVGAMSEMQDFEAALAEGISFAKQNSDTQIIVTADHSTGGLSVGARVNGIDQYHWNSDIVKSFNRTPNKIVELAQLSGSLLLEFENASNIKLKQAHIQLLLDAPLEDYYASLKVVTDIINQLSYTGWTTQGHTGGDVNLYAYGPASSNLIGNHDNTFLAEFIFKLLEL
jgi:alkaline phosphatase